jgi:hypothetical protein
MVVRASALEMGVGRLSGPRRGVGVGGYGTPSSSRIPVASQCGDRSRSRGKLRIPQRPMLLLFLNNSYYRSCGRVRALGRHCPIYRFNVRNVVISFAAYIWISWRGRLLVKQPGRHSKNQGGTVYATLDSKSLSPVTILGDEIL